MAYINDNLNVIRRTDLENQEVEVIWLEVCPQAAQTHVAREGEM